MKNLNYVFIGSFVDPKTNSDKIWGIIELVPPKFDDKLRYTLDGKYLAFWGRRGSKYQTQVIESANPDTYYSAAAKKIADKLDKGYKRVLKTKLDEIYPNFEKDLETTAFWSVLTKSADIGEKDYDFIKSKTDILK